MFKRFQTSSGKVQCRVYLPWCIIIPFLLHQTCDFSSRCIKYTCCQLFSAVYIIHVFVYIWIKKKLSFVPVSSFRSCLGAFVNNFFSILTLCWCRVSFRWINLNTNPLWMSQHFIPKTLFLSTDIYLSISIYLKINFRQNETFQKKEQKILRSETKKKLFDLFTTEDWKIAIQNIFPHLSNLNPLKSCHLIVFLFLSCFR